MQEEEKEHGVCVCREGFALVLTSYAPVTHFMAELGAGLPLHRLAVFGVEEEEEEEEAGGSL